MSIDDGTYHVEFGTPLGSGFGTIVAHGSTVQGGDQGYTYSGSWVVEGDSVTGCLNVRRWRPSEQSVFGDLEKFELQLTGQSVNGVIKAHGTSPAVPGVTITITATLIEKLLDAA